MTAAQLKRWFFWLLCGLFPLALAPLLIAGQACYAARQAESWPLVDAEVVSATASSHCGKGCVHLATIVYRYRVDGHWYQGERMVFGDPSLPSPAAAAQRVAAHPPGSMLRVHVDPGNPGNASVLVGDVGERTWVTAWAAALAYLVAWLVYLFVAYAMRSGLPGR